MNRLIFLCLQILIIQSTLAQTTAEKYVFTTGGNAAILQNYVRLTEIDIETGALTVLDSVRGDFSKAIAVSGRFAYWHVGRIMGSPLGQDLVIQYDLVFNGYTKDNIGHLAITTLDDFGVVVEDLVALDTLASGISSLFAKDDLLYIVSNKYDDQFNVNYAAVTRFNYMDYTFSRYESEGVFAPIDIVDTALVAIFAEGFNQLNINTLSPINSNGLPFYSAGAFDDINKVFYLQVTDFGSFGNVSVVDTLGQTISTSPTDIGGQACAMVYNTAPAIEAQTLNTSGSTQFTYNLPLVDSDGDTLSYTAIATETMTVESIEGNSITGEIDVMEGVVTLEAVDAWEAKDTFLLYVYFPFGTEELKTIETANIYPNPANDLLNVELNSLNEAKYTIVNPLGEELGSAVFIEKTRIPITHLPRGAYLIKIDLDGTVAYRKVLKQ